MLNLNAKLKETGILEISFCWPTAMLERPLRFLSSRCLYTYVCMDGCMDDVGFSSTFQQKR